MGNNFANSFGNFDIMNDIPFEYGMTFGELFGAMINFMMIMFTGNYDPVNFPDGGLMEDSYFYELAFQAGQCLGSIPGECLLMMSV